MCSHPNKQFLKTGIFFYFDFLMDRFFAFCSHYFFYFHTIATITITIKLYQAEFVLPTFNIDENIFYMHTDKTTRNKQNFFLFYFKITINIPYSNLHFSSRLLFFFLLLSMLRFYVVLCGKRS